jgi:hypothetical protein
VRRAGTYVFEARVASAGEGGRFRVEFDGLDRLGSIKIPSTGSWDAWETVRRSGLVLKGGRQTMRIVMERDGATGLVGDIDWLRLTTAEP